MTLFAHTHTPQKGGHTKMSNIKVKAVEGFGARISIELGKDKIRTGIAMDPASATLKSSDGEVLFTIQVRESGVPSISAAGMILVPGRDIVITSDKAEEFSIKDFKLNYGVALMRAEKTLAQVKASASRNGSALDNLIEVTDLDKVEEEGAE